MRVVGMELRGAVSKGANALGLSDDVKSACECVEFSWKQASQRNIYSGGQSSETLLFHGYVMDSSVFCDYIELKLKELQRK